jgi:hypothetical protein
VSPETETWYVVFADPLSFFNANEASYSAAFLTLNVASNPEMTDPSYDASMQNHSPCLIWASAAE